MPSEIPLKTTVFTGVLLGKPYIFAGSVMNGSKSTDVTTIEVKSRTADITALRYTNRKIGIVAVMVIADDEHISVSVLLQFRSQMVLRKIIHLILGPTHTGVISAMKGLVLDTKRMHGDPLLFHRLQVTQEVLGI